MYEESLSVLSEVLVLTFPHSKEDLRRTSVRDSEGEYDLYRLAPKALDWPAESMPDGVNPRSHDEECLKSPVARDIEKTLREFPEDFWLANRGGFVLAESVQFDPEKFLVTLRITDLEIHGMADGATTNAVIRKLQTELRKEKEPGLREALSEARFNVDVVVGLEDRERIGKLIRGRNRSVPVREWTLSDFQGDYNWIKDVIDRPGGRLKGRIGWEENSGKEVTVLDLISLMLLFHPIYDDPRDRRHKAPTAAYSSKGINDQRLIDPKMAPGFRQLEPVLEDIAFLHDHVYRSFHPMYERFKKEVHNTGAKLGKRKGFERKEFALALTGATTKFKVDRGLLFPLLACLRALLTFEKGKAAWRVEPRAFFDAFGSELMETLIEWYEACRGNPQTTGKTKGVYTALHNHARLLLNERLKSAT